MKSNSEIRALMFLYTLKRTHAKPLCTYDKVKMNLIALFSPWDAFSAKHTTVYMFYIPF